MGFTGVPPLSKRQSAYPERATAGRRSTHTGPDILRCGQSLGKYVVTFPGAVDEPIQQCPLAGNARQ